MGSNSSLSRLTVSPQPPPPDRSGRHQKSAIAPSHSDLLAFRRAAIAPQKCFSRSIGCCNAVIESEQPCHGLSCRTRPINEIRTSLAARKGPRRVAEAIWRMCRTPRRSSPHSAPERQTTASFAALHWPVCRLCTRLSRHLCCTPPHSLYTRLPGGGGSCEGVHSPFHTRPFSPPWRIDPPSGTGSPS